MAIRKKSLRAHTGKTSGGNTRDVKIDRIGRVTVYRRGKSYSLYYRESGKTVRKKIDGNLAVAKTTAAQVEASLAKGQRSPIGFDRTSPAQMVEAYLDHVAHTQQLALRTRDRYRAALDRFIEFCDDSSITSIDTIDVARIEDFVRWLRGQTRTRNGASKGKRERYKIGGIKFVLSTCRTAFRWATRRRMLPPLAENPFGEFQIDRLTDREQEKGEVTLLTPAEQQLFFAECNAWQTSIFTMLATYGMRAGELTHLLVDDVDFKEGVIRIRSKPWLCWTVKTRRRRDLPIVEETEQFLRKLIGKRKAGFVFLNAGVFDGTDKPAETFKSPQALRRHVEQIVEKIENEDADQQDRQQQRAVVSFCRSMGQIPEKRLRSEFIKLTKVIGRSDLTRVHDLRHLFASRAQEAGMNPLLVQALLGHATLDMTNRYSHFSLGAKREAMQKLNEL